MFPCRPWLYDLRVVNDGRQKNYTILKNSKKIKLGDNLLLLSAEEFVKEVSVMNHTPVIHSATTVVIYRHSADLFSLCL